MAAGVISRKAGKPRLLDLFCGAGGAAVGYARAGFEVVGVDINPQPNYPFRFEQDDAMSVLRGICTGSMIGIPKFDVVHASPPCQGYSAMSACRPGLSDKYPRLIELVRNGLKSTGKNSPHSPVVRM